MVVTITGYICGLTYLLLFVKLFTRLLKWQRADRLVMRMHEAVSGTFFLSMLLHIIINLVRFRSGAGGLYLSGAAAGLTATLLIALCHMMKEPGARYKVHLILAILALGFIICHFAL